jgi:hypothetical protein
VAENDEHKPGQEGATRRRSLIALGVVAVLFVLGWILTQEIRSHQRIEDCLLSGRTNCVPIESHSSY